MKCYGIYDYEGCRKKWNISESRIRQLLQGGRIEGAVKNGNSWNIPVNAINPWINELLNQILKNLLLI